MMSTDWGTATAIFTNGVASLTNCGHPHSKRAKWLLDILDETAIYKLKRLPVLLVRDAAFSYPRDPPMLYLPPYARTERIEFERLLTCRPVHAPLVRGGDCAKLPRRS